MKRLYIIPALFFCLMALATNSYFIWDYDVSNAPDLGKFTVSVYSGGQVYTNLTVTNFVIGPHTYTSSIVSFPVGVYTTYVAASTTNGLSSFSNVLVFSVPPGVTNLALRLTTGATNGP